MLTLTPLAALPSVVAQHHDNAVSQLEQRARLATELRSTLKHLARFDERLEANLDGLRIVGSTAIEFEQAAIANDPLAAGVVALLLAESDSNQPDAAAQAVSLLRLENPEIRQAAWWGLRLASPRHMEPHLHTLLGKSKRDFASAAALAILAFHRLPAQTDLGDLADGESEEVAWLLAEAGGRMPGTWDGARFKQFMSKPSIRVREAALRASARSGIPELLTWCREAASQSNAAALESISFLGVVGSQDDLMLLQRAASSPETANAAVSALGRLGLPDSVPALLDLLEVPTSAEAAAAAVQRITSLAVPRCAPPQPPAELSEEERDLWEPTLPVDVPLTRDWWKSNQGRFNREKRWQFGLSVSDDPLGPVFDQLPLAVRYDVYLRQRALVPGTPDWELETWTWKQKRPTS